MRNTVSLSEDDYLDYKREYENLVYDRTFSQKYPQLTGCWLKDIQKFLTIKLEEQGKIQKQEPIQQKEEKQPTVLWNLNQNKNEGH